MTAKSLWEYWFLPSTLPLLRGKCQQTAGGLSLSDCFSKDALEGQIPNVAKMLVNASIHMILLPGMAERGPGSPGCGGKLRSSPHHAHQEAWALFLVLHLITQASLIYLLQVESWDCGHWAKQSCGILLNDCFTQWLIFQAQLWL